MKCIKILDTTLRDGEQSPGCSMTIEEKLVLAKKLDQAGVDIIEAGFAIASEGDFEAIQAVSKVVENATVSSLSRALKKDIHRAWESVRYAKKPRIHTFIATSKIHMEHKLQMTEDEVYDQAVKMVTYAKSLCDDIEFTAEDAVRTEYDFLKRIYQGAIDAGATVLNIPDTVGYTTPDEYYSLFNNLSNDLKNLENVDLSVHCHNDLGLAVANSLAAIKGGATQIECTINGIGERAGNASLEEIVMAIKTRKDVYDVKTDFDSKKIMDLSKTVSFITGVKVQPNKAIVGDNAFAHESGIHQHGVLKNKETYEIMTPESIGLETNSIVLGKHSGRHAFVDRLKGMGFTLTEEEINDAFKKFKDLVDVKKTIYEKDLIAIVEDRRVEAPIVYDLKDYVISTGSDKKNMATVTLIKDNEIFEQVAGGDGPVDSAYNAIAKISGIKSKLMDYKMESVTEGEDAQGEAHIKIAFDDYLVTGRGVSPSVIEASIYAYVNALNRYIELSANISS